MKGRHDASESNAAGALDVIIEAGHLWGVLVEDSAGVGKTEVLEVDVGFGVSLPSRLHKRVHEFVVFLSSNSGLPQTEIAIILQKVFVVRATIQNYWQCSGRINTSTQGVNDQFGHRDENGTNSLVTNSQNLFQIMSNSCTVRVESTHLLPIADHNYIDIVRFAPDPHVVLDPIDIIDVQETSLGSPK